MGWMAEEFIEIQRKLNDLIKSENSLSTKLTRENEQLRSDLEAARKEFKLLNDKLDVIIKNTSPSDRPVKMELQFEGKEPNMPGIETDIQTIPCTEIETDAAGNPVTINPGNVTWAIDNPAIAALTQNSDGSATFKALTLGTANVSCTDNSVTPPVVGTDTLTVTAGPGTKLVLQFGTAA
jgi:hypothetical protein